MLWKLFSYTQVRIGRQKIFLVMRGSNQLMWQYCCVCVAILQWLRGARTAMVQGSDSDRLWLWLQLGFGNRAAASLSSVIDSRLLWALSEAIKNQSLTGFLSWLSLRVCLFHTHDMCARRVTLTHKWLKHTHTHTHKHTHTLTTRHPPTHTHTRHTHTHTHSTLHRYTNTHWLH